MQRHASVGAALVFYAHILETLFTFVAQERLRVQEAEAERKAIAGSLFTHRQLIEKYHTTLADEMGAGKFGSAACAGAIMVMFNNMLQGYRDDLKAINPKWDRIDPQLVSRSFVR